MEKSTFATPSDLEVVMSRTFSAPRQLLWKAYATPELIPEWWGPARYATTVDTMEFEVGGTWRYIQKGDDGDEFAFRGEYLAIEAPEKIAYTFEFEGFPGQIIEETVVFTEVDGATTVTVTSLFPSKEARDGMLESGMREGSEESYERLDQLVQTLA